MFKHMQLICHYTDVVEMSVTFLAHPIHCMQ